MGISNVASVAQKGLALPILLPVAASTNIACGDLVMFDAAGNVALSADTSGAKFLGVAATDADNSSGVAGAVSVSVEVGGVSLVTTSSAALTNNGSTIYCDASQAGATSTTNSVVMGTQVGFVSSTRIYVAFTGHQS